MLDLLSERISDHEVYCFFGIVRQRIDDQLKVRGGCRFGRFREDRQYRDEKRKRVQRLLRVTYKTTMSEPRGRPRVWVQDMQHPSPVPHLGSLPIYRTLCGP